MPFIFSFKLFIGTTSEPPDPDSLLDIDQPGAKRRRAHLHLSEEIGNPEISDNDVRQVSTGRSAQGDLDEQNSYNPYGLECETASNSETAREQDRESLALLLHYFSSAPGHRTGAPDPNTTAPSSSFVNSSAVSSTPWSQLHGLNGSLPDGAPSSTHPQDNESDVSIDEEESDSSHFSMSQRFPFEGQISGLLLRSIPVVLPDDPVYASQGEDEAEEEENAIGSGPVVDGQLRKADDSTRELHDLFEQLRSKDSPQGNVSRPASEMATPSLGGGLDDGSDGGAAAVDRHVSIASRSLTTPEHNGHAAVSSSGMIASVCESDEQNPPREEKGEIEMLDNEGQSSQFETAGGTPADGPGELETENARRSPFDPEPTLHEASDAVKADDRRLGLLGHSTKRPHYSLPTKAFRMRNRTSSPHSTTSSAAASTAARRAANLLREARSLTQELRRDNRLSSRLSPSSSARIPAATRHGLSRITTAPPPQDGSGRAVPQAASSRTASWHTAASASSSSSSYVPGLPASLTPIVIRGGGRRQARFRSITSKTQAAAPAEAVPDTHQDAAARLRDAESDSSGDGTRFSSSPLHGLSQEQDEEAGVPLSQSEDSCFPARDASVSPSAIVTQNPSSEVFMSTSSSEPGTFADLDPNDDDDSDDLSSHENAVPADTSTDQCIHFDMPSAAIQSQEFAAGFHVGGSMVAVSPEPRVPREQDDEQWEKLSAGEENQRSVQVRSMSRHPHRRRGVGL